MTQLAVRTRIPQRKSSGSFQRGHRPWNTGKQWDLATRQKISLSRMGQHNGPTTFSPEARLKMSLAKKGKPFAARYDQPTVIKLREMWKAIGRMNKGRSRPDNIVRNKDRAFTERRLQAMWASWESRPPSVLERRIIAIIQRFTLPYRFVGNGQYLIAGLCPDFINTNGDNVVIEVYGRAWHTPDVFKPVPATRLPRVRAAIFKEHGFRTIELLEETMKEVSDEQIASIIELGGVSWHN